MIPGAVLGTAFLAKLLQGNAPAWKTRLAVVTLVFVLAAASRNSRLDHGIGKFTFREFVRLCSGKNATCVGFAPWHPIFCRDATGLYLLADLLSPCLKILRQSIVGSTYNYFRRQSQSSRRESQR